MNSKKKVMVKKTIDYTEKESDGDDDKIIKKPVKKAAEAKTKKVIEHDEKDSDGDDDKVDKAIKKPTKKSLDTKSKTKRGAWDQEEINKALTLFTSGKTLAEVADELSRTEKSVKFKIYPMVADEADKIGIKKAELKYNIPQEEIEAFAKKQSSQEVLVEIKSLLVRVVELLEKKK